MRANTRMQFSHPQALTEKCARGESKSLHDRAGGALCFFVKPTELRGESGEGKCFAAKLVSSSLATPAPCSMAHTSYAEFMSGRSMLPGGSRCTWPRTSASWAHKEHK
eukprot:1157834-Pelagomonas_calceolata.AAC.19